MTQLSSVYILDEEGNEISCAELFPAEFFHALTAHMRITPDDDALQDLKAGHEQAVSAYMSSKRDLANKTTLRQDNKHLESIAYHADKLVELLAGLCSHPPAKERLSAEIVANPTAFTGRKGVSLSLLLDMDREHTLFTIQQLISDLWASAKRAQIKPRPDPVWRGSLLSEHPEHYKLALLSHAALEPSLVHEDTQRTYRKKSEPIIAFITAFAGTWRRHCDLTYGAGMHLRESGGTKSVAVDAVHLSINRLDAKIKRSQIVTAFRKWSESEPEISQI